MLVLKFSIFTKIVVFNSMGHIFTFYLNYGKEIFGGNIFATLEVFWQHTCTIHPRRKAI
jgi:hypothetical protein